jgi:hypothetical protein
MELDRWVRALARGAELEIAFQKKRMRPYRRPPEKISRLAGVDEHGMLQSVVYWGADAPIVQIEGKLFITKGELKCLECIKLDPLELVQLEEEWVLVAAGKPTGDAAFAGVGGLVGE